MSIYIFIFIFFGLINNFFLKKFISLSHSLNIISKPKDRIDIIIEYSKMINFRKIKIDGFGKWKDYKFDEI